MLCWFREESGKPDSDMDEPSWIMTVKGPHGVSKAVPEENHVKKVSQNGSGPQTKTIMQEANHYRSDRRSERSEKTPSVRCASHAYSNHRIINLLRARGLDIGPLLNTK